MGKLKDARSDLDRCAFIVTFTHMHTALTTHTCTHNTCTHNTCTHSTHTCMHTQHTYMHAHTAHTTQYTQHTYTVLMLTLYVHNAVHSSCICRAIGLEPSLSDAYWHRHLLHLLQSNNQVPDGGVLSGCGMMSCCFLLPRLLWRTFRPY